MGTFSLSPSFYKCQSGQSLVLPLLALLLALPPMGQGCPHEGPDHRLFGGVGCAIQRKLTIEKARPPRTIWSFHLLKVSVKIDPKHPHLLVEWPARRRRLWRFRVGYRWDANAKAYIFPSLALKKVDSPMPEYQKDAQRADARRALKSPAPPNNPPPQNPVPTFPAATLPIGPPNT